MHIPILPRTYKVGTTLVFSSSNLEALGIVVDKAILVGTYLEAPIVIANVAWASDKIGAYGRNFLMRNARELRTRSTFLPKIPSAVLNSHNHVVIMLWAQTPFRVSVGFEI